MKPQLHPCAVEPCDGCDTRAGTLVIVGEQSTHDSATAWICETCLREALALIDQHKERAR